MAANYFVLRANLLGRTKNVIGTQICWPRHTITFVPEKNSKFCNSISNCYQSIDEFQIW